MSGKEACEKSCLPPPHSLAINSGTREVQSPAAAPTSPFPMAVSEAPPMPLQGSSPAPAAMGQATKQRPGGSPGGEGGREEEPPGRFAASHSAPQGRGRIGPLSGALQRPFLSSLHSVWDPTGTSREPSLRGHSQGHALTAPGPSRGEAAAVQGWQGGRSRLLSFPKGLRWVCQAHAKRHQPGGFLAPRTTFPMHLSGRGLPEGVGIKTRKASHPPLTHFLHSRQF